MIREIQKKNGKNSYLKLLYREGKGILFNHGFHRPILSTKHPERCEGGFVGKIGLGNPCLSNIFKLPKKFELKMRDFL